MYKRILFIFFILNLSSPDCFSQKKEQISKQGVVTKKDYLVEIPFHYIYKHIFIEVLINQKKYNFLFDTGYEFSAIDQNISTEINYHFKKEIELSGSSIKPETVSLVELPTIVISSVNFENTYGIIQNLSFIDADSLKIDGVIGNNLIRKANWQIDYKKHIIKISDQIDNFNISKAANVIKMGKRKWGIGYIDVSIDSKKHQFLFDLGSSGRFTTNTENPDQKNRSIIAKKIKLGDLELYDQTISLEKDVSSLIGNAFFQDYLLTIDWNNSLLYLLPQTEVKTPQ